MLITERKMGIFDITNIFFLEDPNSINILDSDVVTYHTYLDCGNIKGFEKKIPNNEN
jgi:hypothetical protein